MLVHHDRYVDQNRREARQLLDPRSARQRREDAGQAQLVQRGQVDRAKRLDLARNAGDFRLQPAGAAPFVRLVGQVLGQGLAVDLAGVELLGELFLGQAGALLE